MSLPGEGQVDILFNNQSACQPAAIGQPCEKMPTCQMFDWSDSWWWENWGPNHIGPQSRVPALPLVPLGGVTYLTKARQVTQMSYAALIYHWHYLQGLFAVLYLHDLITYSCTKCREMLSRLFSVQTNLLISFHHQSGLLLHQRYYFLGTIFIIINRKCYGKNSVSSITHLTMCKKDVWKFEHTLCFRSV